MNEEIEIIRKGPRAAFQHTEHVQQKAVPITAIETDVEPRVGTDLEELERVLGGGVGPG